MYNPKHFDETDLETLHLLIEAHPLGTWVTSTDTGLVVNHLPFLVDKDRGEKGMLVGHVARANPIWKLPSAGLLAVIVFQGPQTYISPSWYPSKNAHGRAVPTWNYAVVHAYGRPEAIDDKDWLHEHVSQLSNTHEAGQAVPWQVSDAPSDYIDKMLNAIVGIQIDIVTLEGRWKVSQNKPSPDKLGIVAGLSARNDNASHEMARLVNQHIKL